MLFTSDIFLFYFLPAVLLVYHNLPYAWRNPFLVLASYVFYGWWRPWFVCLMMATTAVDFAMARVIAAPGASSRRRRVALVTSCVVDLGLLAFFKYFMFSAESLNALLELVGAEPLSILRVALPVGISFYTFKSLSYTIDVYRGDARPARTLLEYACFVSLFPQLLAGPITRFGTVAEQLESRHGYRHEHGDAHRAHAAGRFASGVAIFLLGFSKKVLLANPAGEVADALFGAESPVALDAWVGVAAYAFQIYFDFCGYSDMAVGLGRMLGFEFLKNFDAPYRSESITELWRRWHISLSTFLRDYLYIPLGGNRKGPARTYVNLMAVMLLGGLWHGAKWNFVAWGGYHGVLLAWERWRGKRSAYEALPRAGRVAVTFALMLVSWVLFRAEDLSAAWQYLGSMLGLRPASLAGALVGAEVYTPYHLLVLGACAVLVFQPVQAHDWAERPMTWGRVAVLAPLFLLGIAAMVSQAFHPFLYFQF